MPTYTVPYVEARVTRNPMNTTTRVCLAHEVFILQKKFGEVLVEGPHLKADGQVMTRAVDPNEEYSRLGEAHGNDKDSDKPFVEEVFGQPFSSTWKDALSQGLALFDFDGDVPADNADDGEPNDKAQIVASIMNQMQAADPMHQNEKWWTGGKAEVREVNRRLKAEGHEFTVTAKERNEIADTVDTEPRAEAQSNGEPIINGPAVMARMDELGIEYDPDTPPVELANQLYRESIDQVQALGGQVEDGATLQDVSDQLDRLIAE